MASLFSWDKLQSPSCEGPFGSCLDARSLRHQLGMGELDQLVNLLGGFRRPLESVHAGKVVHDHPEDRSEAVFDPPQLPDTVKIFGFSSIMFFGAPFAPHGDRIYFPSSVVTFFHHHVSLPVNQLFFATSAFWVSSHALVPPFLCFFFIISDRFQKSQCLSAKNVDKCLIL